MKNQSARSQSDVIVQKDPLGSVPSVSTGAQMT